MAPPAPPPTITTLGAAWAMAKRDTPVVASAPAPAAPTSFAKSLRVMRMFVPPICGRCPMLSGSGQIGPFISAQFARRRKTGLGRQRLELHPEQIAALVADDATHLLAVRKHHEGRRVNDFLQIRNLGIAARALHQRGEFSFLAHAVGTADLFIPAGAVRTARIAHHHENRRRRAQVERRGNWRRGKRQPGTHPTAEPPTCLRGWISACSAPL